MLGIVFFNTIMIIIYGSIDDEETLTIIESFDTFFNSVYILDVVIKIIGLGFKDYFSDFWN